MPLSAPKIDRRLHMRVWLSDVPTPAALPHAIRRLQATSNEDGALSQLMLTAYRATIDYEGEEYGACDEYAVEDDSAEQTARIREAFSHLTATQQRRLRLYANGKTLREIAAIEEASFQSVSESIEAGRKKFLKILSIKVFIKYF